MSTAIPAQGPHGPAWAPTPREPFTWESPGSEELRSFTVPTTWGPGARAGSVRITNNTRGTLLVAYGAGRTVDVGAMDAQVGPYSTSTLPLDRDGVSMRWQGLPGQAGDRPQVVSVELVAQAAPPVSSSLGAPASSGLDPADHMWKPSPVVVDPEIAIGWVVAGTTIMSARVVNATPRWIAAKRDSAGGGWIAWLPPFSSSMITVGAQRLWLQAHGGYHRGGAEAFVRVQLFDVEQEDSGPFYLPILTEPQGDGLQRVAASSIGWPGVGVFGSMLDITQGRTFVLARLEITLMTSGGPASNLDKLQARTARSYDGLSAGATPLLETACLSGLSGGMSNTATFDGPLLVSSSTFPDPINRLEIGPPSNLVAAAWVGAYQLYGWYLPDNFV